MRDTPPGEGSDITGGEGGVLLGTGEDEQPNWAAMARAADNASTSWLNSSRRAAWGDSLAMFQGRHPSGSKYHGADYRYRTRLFRPKARAAVRKTEAATAQAFFSNVGVCAIDAENPDDPAQNASAELLKELLQIRLTKHIPWFLTLVGARQDCEVYGLCVSRQYWKYEEKLVGAKHAPQLDQFGSQVIGEDGSPVQDRFDIYQVASDHPDIELIAPDNFRFDPGCDWTRPVESSPYIIQRIPMFVGDCKEKMRSGEWTTYADGILVGAKDNEDDATKRARENSRQPSDQSQASSIQDFDITWVHLNTLRWQGRDYVFYTLGPDKLLTDPKPHIEVYGTEKRPYAMGITNLEAHRNYPAAKLEILRDLQAQANDTANLRLDALKLSLQPRVKVKTGTTVGNNLADLRVFMPGKAIQVTSMEDFEWDKPPDVSQASFYEQDRINADIDELSGAASQSLSTTPGAANETATGMELLAGAAGTISEYELRLFKETWVEEVIRQLVDLEQRLEEDETILALAGQKAQLVQKYNVDQITDWLLSQSLTIKVDVGMGATNPITRLSQLKIAAEMLASLFGPSLASGLKFDEVCNVVFGAVGQADGKRFFVEGFDPHQAMMQLEQAKQGGQFVDPHKMEEVQIKANTDLQKTQMQTDSAERIAQMHYGGDANQPDYTKLTEAQIKAASDMRLSALQADSRERVASISLQRETVKQNAETRRAQLQHENDLKGHVIRTLPPALAKLIVAKHQTGHEEKMARLHPKGAA